MRSLFRARVLHIAFDCISHLTPRCNKSLLPHLCSAVRVRRSRNLLTKAFASLLGWRLAVTGAHAVAAASLALPDEHGDTRTHAPHCAGCPIGLKRAAVVAPADVDGTAATQLHDYLAVIQTAIHMSWAALAPIGKHAPPTSL
jgi:hypothetical protein